MQLWQLSNDEIVQIRAYNYLSLASFFLLYYDYLLTLGDEIEFFWGRRFNTVTSLFFVNRYFSLFINIPILAHNVGYFSARNCDTLHTLNQITTIVVQVIVAGISAIRTYALCECRRWTKLVLAFFILTGAAVAGWSVSSKSTGSGDLASELGCHSSISHKDGTRFSVIWACLFVYDTVIFSLTLWRALDSNGLNSHRLFRVLIRDGCIYFFVIGLSNLCNILTFLLAPPFLKGFSTASSTIIASALASRLLLNIQNPDAYESVNAREYAVSSNFYVSAGELDTSASISFSRAHVRRVPVWHHDASPSESGMSQTLDESYELSEIRARPL